jgi:hypothetical protein
MINKKLDLIVYHGTILKVDKLKLKQHIPSDEEIINHIKLQSDKPKEKIQLIKIELNKEAFDEAYKEITIKACTKVKNDFIVICIETNKYPIILITKK